MLPLQPHEIVTLGQEILRHEHLAQRAMLYVKKAAKRHSPGLRSAQLAAAIAPAYAMATGPLLEELSRPINRYERFELSALIFYAAQQAHQAERRVRESLRHALDLPRLDPLAVIDYLRARDWLWETFGPHRAARKEGGRL